MQPPTVSYDQSIRSRETMAQSAAVYTQRIPRFIGLLPFLECFPRELATPNDAGSDALFELFNGQFYDFDGLITGFHCFFLSLR